MYTDWYLIATPFFSLIVVFTLVALKLALKSQIDISSSQMKKLKSKQIQKAQRQQITIEQKPASMQVLTYLYKNHSFLQPCFANKAKNKLPILLSFSAISLLCFLNPNIIVNSFVGFMFTLAFIISQVFMQPDTSTSVLDGQVQDFTSIRQQVKDQASTISKFKWLYISFSVIGSGLGLTMAALVWKNYSNSFLGLLLRNIVVSCAADLLINKSIGFLLLSFPLSFSTRVLAMIENQKLRDFYKIVVEQDKNALKNCATNLSPRKKQSNSPTKIPKALVPRLTRQNSENEALKSALEIAKKIKRQKNVQSDLIQTLTRANEVDNANALSEQYSINQLFEQVQKREKSIKGRQTPIAMFGEQDENNTNGQKTRRKQTDLVIVEFKRNEQKSDEEKDEEVIQRRAGSFLHSNLDFQDDVHKREESQYAAQNRLNFVKLLNQCNQDNQEDEQRQRRRHDNSVTLTIQRNYDPLRINNNGQTIQAHEMQQIDANSPERRRKFHGQEEENSQYKLKKKVKHFAGNSKRRVIKFTSGQPYLEYLPNMLSKDHAKHKKSQPINCKQEFESIIQDRRKSVKKVKTKKQPRLGFVGDENQFPGAMEVEDL